MENVIFAARSANEDYSDIDEQNLPDFSVELKDLKLKLKPSDSVLEDTEVATFIDENKNVNTSKKTRADLNVFSRWCKEIGEERDLKDIPVPELNRILSHFSVKVGKADGNEYEPDTLTSYSRSFDR
jgi:hypothetical protein